MSKRNNTKNKGGGFSGQIKPQFTMYTKQKDIEEFMSWVKKNYKKNVKLATWYGDHIFGKAIQPVEGDFKGNITLTFDNSFKQ